MLSSKREMLKSLGCLFNITEASMYPDFDGFARLYAHDKPYYAHDKPYIVSSPKIGLHKKLQFTVDLSRVSGNLSDKGLAGFDTPN